jgi:hypothetical protein
MILSGFSSPSTPTAAADSKPRSKWAWYKTKVHPAKAGDDGNEPNAKKSVAEVPGRAPGKSSGSAQRHFLK